MPVSFTYFLCSPQNTKIHPCFKSADPVSNFIRSGQDDELREVHIIPGMAMRSPFRAGQCWKNDDEAWLSTTFTSHNVTRELEWGKALPAFT